MKKLFLGFIFLGMQPVTFAVNPTPGAYVGIILAGSYATSLSQNINVPQGYTTKNSNLELISENYQANLGSGHYQANLAYAIQGAVGGQIGYREDKFRGEIEIFYNSNPYSSLSLKTPDGTSYSLSGSQTTTGAYMQGQTNTAAAVINLFYDMLPPDYIDSYFAPFIGIGAGVASVSNQIKLYYNQTQEFKSHTKTHNGLGGQVIVGALFFLDDFSYFSVDFRYFTTTKYTQTAINGYNYTTQNQLLSVNLSFDSALNLG